MIGDTYIINGQEFEVIWAGGEGLIPDRSTLPDDLWTAPKRAYNKKSSYWQKLKNPLDKPENPAQAEAERLEEPNAAILWDD